MRVPSSLLLLAVLATPVFAQNSRTDEQALRELWARFEEAANRYDAAKVASFYSEDADRISGAFELAQGRAQIAKQYEADFTQRRGDTTSRPLRAELRIRLLRPGVALVDGHWDGMRSGKRVRGHFTVIATKDAGGWQIAAGRVRGLQER